MPTDLSGVAPAVTFLDFWQRWDFTNPLLAVLYVAIAAYYFGLFRLLRRGVSHAVQPWRVGSATLAFVLLLLALAGPMDTFADELFFVHMIQHVLLVMAAAPLLLGASPMPIYMWSLPETVRIGASGALERRGFIRVTLAFFTRPCVALPLFIGILYAWHLPTAYQLAIRNPYVHYGEHLSMFVVSAFFWWPIIGPAPVRSRLAYPQRLFYVLLAVTPTAALGAIITLTGHILYPDYLTVPRHFGMTAREDQVMAGLIMWIPGNLVYLGTMTTLFFNWANQEREESTSEAAAYYRHMKRVRDARQRQDESNGAG